MVKLHIKKGEESQFLYDTTVQIDVDVLLSELLPIYNGRLKVQRICAEVEQLASHGICLPPNMQGLAEEQIEELHLVDEWATKCEPSGGSVFKKDDIGRRSGNAPNENMAEVLKKAVKEVKDMVSKKQVEQNQAMTLAKVTEAIDILRGAVTIVYPMGLPPHDPIQEEFENNEDLTGTQASKEVLEEQTASIWFAGKEMLRGKKLKDSVGNNEKTKLIAKLQKKGSGAPAREAVVSEEEQKQMMAYAYRKQEDMKKLAEADDDSYLNSGWADSGELKRQFQGLTNIKWGPR